MRVGQMAPRAGATTVPAPLVLGRYRLHRRLGAGGFGTVWMARDEHLQRDVAVKILPRERVVGGRFEREARAAARLSHPSVVTLFEAATDDEGAYLVSELVHGTTFDRALAAGRLSDRAILAIGIGLCDALAHAHAHGVVHRDVKPSNVLIPARGVPAAKLTDFGVARVIGGNTLTRTGELVGTLLYMAPEQAEGREAAAPADLYSLALVLYEALTGINPVPVARLGAPRARRLSLHLPPLRRQRRELPRELGQAIDHALRPRPSERGSLAELRAGLQAGAGRVSDTPGVVAPPRLPRLPARRGWRAAPGEAPDTVDEPSARPDTVDEPSARPDQTDATANPGAAGPPEARGPYTPPWAGAPGRDVPASGSAAPLGAQMHMSGAPRLAAAACSAGVWAWLAATLLAPPPLPVAMVALIAGLAAAVVPRLSWMALALALVAALCAQDRAGAAVLVAPALALPGLLLMGSPNLWSLSGVAPALGAVGLAGGWPALAAMAGGPWRRAALGAVGWCWVCVAAVLTGDRLYLRAPRGLPAPSVWIASPYDALHHVVLPLGVGAAPAGAAVWALAAAALPIVRARRSGVSRALAVGVWALCSVGATALALRAVGYGPMEPGVAVSTLGAGFGAVVALARRPVGVPIAASDSARLA